MLLFGYETYTGKSEDKLAYASGKAKNKAERL